jgi:hypothetical protein
LRDECRLRFFENSVLRKIFGPERAKAAQQWRILHNEELYNLFSSQNIICMFKSRRK